MDFHLTCPTCSGTTQAGGSMIGQTVTCINCERALAVPKEKIGPGTVVGGRVRLIEKIGEGGFATVWLAEQLGTGRQVAVKMLRLSLPPKERQRFQSEIRLVATLDHPVLVSALDAGEDEGHHFLIMPLIDGETLREHVNRNGPLPEAEALRVAGDLADAMDMAWQLEGLVHRDIKPENIMRTGSGETKLLDLGIARSAGQETLTATNALFGTPATMSPEQINDPRGVDCRSDMYSLGCTLYYLLAGTFPFADHKGHALLNAHCHTPPPDIREAAPEVSESTAELVRDLLRKDRTERPADWVALKQRMGVVSAVPIADRLRRRTKRKRAGHRSSGFSDSSGSNTTGGTRRTAFAGLGLGLVLAALLGGLFWFGPGMWRSPKGPFKGPLSPPFRALALEPERLRSPDLSAIALDQLPAQITFVITNTPSGQLVHLPMNLVRPGRFTMGRGAFEFEHHPDRRGLVSTPHTVEITQPYYLAVTELTLDQFCHLKPWPLSEDGKGWHPAFDLVWADVSDDSFPTITKSAMRRYGSLLPAGYEFRLPTEAEWEYACRAGTTTVFASGDDPHRLRAFGRFAAEESAPVAQLEPNPWGFYDMHGNIAEWVLDGYLPYPEPGGRRVDPVHGRDGRLGSVGRLRLVRGGSYLSSTPWQCSSGFRQPLLVDDRLQQNGFRFAIAPRIERKR